MECRELNHQDETAALAIKLAKLVKPGMFICLTGDLGAGKTTFTQYFAKGLGIEEPITSPTFTIVQEYEGKLPLYHFDVYRIGQASGMDDLGYEEYFYGNGVCVVEWADLIQDIIPKEHLWITLKVLGETQREICLDGAGQTYEHMIKELFEL